ncbi:MAG: TGS domain-containing protein, partial [Woeseiaceae bacterium]
MPTIRFPDGATRSFDAGATGLDIAEGISRSLARDAVAVRVDGELRDLSRVVDRDATVEVVARDSADGLELLRHDAAHVL